MMTTLVLRALAALLFLAAALGLVGCGPGVGGTGNGEPAVPVEFFGARPASVCSSALSSALICPAGTDPNPPGPINPVGAGSAAVLLADSPSAQRVSAEINGNLIELEAHCDGLVFLGRWGVMPDGQARYFGSLTTPASAEPQPAVLTAKATANAGLNVQLTDAAGNRLYGPLGLQRVDSLPPRAGCP
jgi:hypothetical protein